MSPRNSVIFSIFSVALATSACVNNPITGRSQVMMVSDNEAAQESAQAYSSLLSQAQKSQALDSNPETLQRVRSITDRLIQQAIALRPETRGWQWDVHVLDSDEVNAWCMAGGKMAIYNGLLQKIRPSDDEIAQVMGHEISHALLSHQAEKISRKKMQSAGLQVGVLAGAMAGVDLRGVAGITNTLATVGLELPNSRENESEAMILPDRAKKRSRARALRRRTC